MITLPEQQDILKRLKDPKHVSAYFDSLEPQEGSNKLGTSVRHGVKQNPDTSAKDQVNARRFDVPVEFAGRNTEELTQVATEQDILKKLQDAEHTRKFFENPDRAASNHDNAGAMVKLENTVKAAGSSISSAALNWTEGFYRLPETGSRLYDLALTYTGSRALSRA